jgi:hypothetical protein
MNDKDGVNHTEIIAICDTYDLVLKYIHFKFGIKEDKLKKNKGYVYFEFGDKGLLTIRKADFVSKQ